MKYLTFDTNYIEGTSFMFDSYFFEIIKEHIKEENIKIILSSIIDNEIIRHLESWINDNISKYQRCFKKLQFLEEDLSLPKIEKKENIITIALDKYDKFKRDLDIEIISADNVSPEEVFNDYFEKKGAFSNSKPNEFKDSFAFKSIKKYVGDNPLYVLSKDNDWKSMINEEQDEFFMNHNKLIDRLNSFEETYKLACTEYVNKNSKLIEELEDKILGELYEFSYPYDDVEIKECYIEDIKINDITILEKDSIDNTIELFVNFHVVCMQDVSYQDYDNGVWDSEDKEYAYLPNVDANIKYSIYPYILLNLKFKDNKAGIEIISHEVNSIETDINDSSDIDIKEINSEEESYEEYYDTFDEYFGNK